MVDMKGHDKDNKKYKPECAVSQETLLKLAKEITIKFIEVGRITPASFPESFSDIYKTLKSTITDTENA
jgi:hypothetical protein